MKVAGSNAGARAAAAKLAEDASNDGDADAAAKAANRAKNMQGGRAATAEPSFTVEAGPPTDMKAEEVDKATSKNADPDQRVVKWMELSTLHVHPTSRVEKPTK